MLLLNRQILASAILNSSRAIEQRAINCSEMSPRTGHARVSQLFRRRKIILDASSERAHGALRAWVALPRA
jgi:hypothetical protein